MEEGLGDILVVCVVSCDGGVLGSYAVVKKKIAFEVMWMFVEEEVEEKQHVEEVLEHRELVSPKIIQFSTLLIYFIIITWRCKIIT